MSAGKRLLSGHETIMLSNEELEKAGQDLVLYKSGMVKIQPEGWMYPGIATRYLDRINKMEFRPDDVIIMTFPKCGTTWMQEILWNMLRNPNLDPNNKEALEPLWSRSVDISFDMIMDNNEYSKTGFQSMSDKFDKLCPPTLDKYDGLGLNIADHQPSPRLMKSHFPLELFPKDILNKCKVVYVTRNPKDMLVSFYHYVRVAKGGGYKCPIDKFVKDVMNGDMLYCPFWPHVKQAWAQRDNPNLYFTTYENMKDDIMQELRNVNKFLGTNLTEQQLKNISEYTNFSNMKSRGEPIDKSFYDEKTWNELGGMFRKGQKGDWKNHFTAEQLQEIDDWINDNIRGTGLTFKYGK